jgi:hypothetical protein
MRERPFLGAFFAAQHDTRVLVAFPPERDSYPLGDRRSRRERPPEPSAPAHRPGRLRQRVDVSPSPRRYRPCQKRPDESVTGLGVSVGKWGDVRALGQVEAIEPGVVRSEPIGEADVRDSDVPESLLVRLDRR